MQEPASRHEERGPRAASPPTAGETESGVTTARDVWCTELELSSAAPAAEDPALAGRRLRVLVRLHQVPVGFVTVDHGVGRQPEVLRTTALAELAEPVADHLDEDGLERERGDDLLEAVHRPCSRPLLADHVSVVVGTRNRPGHVRDCLRQLLELDYASFDVVVVDNAPDDDETRDAFTGVVGKDPRFRYVRLGRPGVSRARNAGIAAARGPLVAFIDDDVRVDPFWLQGLARTFHRVPSAVCVTGLVATREIVGLEQRYFDSRVSWAANLEPRVYHPTSEDPLHPWAAGRFGAGANMAFRLGAVRALGGFDENLGPGTRAKGGEDMDLFVRALRAGGDLVYDPGALAWHIHRSEAADLEKQMFGYGIGLTAYLTKHALQPVVALEMVRRLPAAVRHVLRVTRAPERQGIDAASARHYRRIELTGMVLGPLYYLRSRIAGRTSRGTAT